MAHVQIQKYFLKNGKQIETAQRPTAAVTIETSGDHGNKKKTKTVFSINLAGQVIKLEPVDKVPNCWAEAGLHASKPKPGDQIIARSGEEMVATKTVMKSAVRPGVFLVDSNIGDSIWVEQKAYPLPIWEQTAQAA